MTTTRRQQREDEEQEEPRGNSTPAGVPELVQAIQQLQENQHAFMSQMMQLMESITANTLTTSRQHQQESKPPVQQASETSGPTRPKRYLKEWSHEDHPDEKPVEFQKWTQNVLKHGAYYHMSEEELLEEMRYHASALVEHRIDTILHAWPNISVPDLCSRLVTRSLPEDVNDDLYRDYIETAQQEDESGTSFVRRFENAVAALARQGEHVDPSRQFRDFRVKLNKTYRARMREQFSPHGSLSRIADPTERLLAAISQVRVVSKDQPRDKSYHEVSSQRSDTAYTPQVNAVSTQSRNHFVPEAQVGGQPEVPSQISPPPTKVELCCRTCKSANNPCDHDWKKCCAALSRCFCRRCGTTGHPTHLHSNFVSPTAEDNQALQPTNADTVNEEDNK